MSLLFRIVAVLQIAGGFYGFATLLLRLLAGGHGGIGLLMLVIGLLMSVFALVAGVMLIEGAAMGVTLSRIVQGLQIPVIGTSWLSYAWHTGAAAPLTVIFGRRVTADIDWSVPSQAWRLATGGHSTTVLGINLLALACWLLLRFARR
ncbi:hypothetical protein [Coralloluteibacterium thermophilus]|uniref:ABC transporter permease n=1 Tax=Coralloluteibacterium thermophilum TaxID=2707049 RepID=A0ABV9NN50_9GAMM